MKYNYVYMFQYKYLIFSLFFFQFYYIGKLGCQDPVKISNTFYIYMQLCEGKNKYTIVNFKRHLNRNICLQIKDFGI